MDRRSSTTRRPLASSSSSARSPRRRRRATDDASSETTTTTTTTGGGDDRRVEEEGEGGGGEGGTIGGAAAKDCSSGGGGNDDNNDRYTNGSSNSSNNSNGINHARRFLDSKPTAVDGCVSYAYGLCAPRPLRRLDRNNGKSSSRRSRRSRFALWERWADELPHLYRTGRYVDYFEGQPVLDAAGRRGGGRGGRRRRATTSRDEDDGGGGGDDKTGNDARLRASQSSALMSQLRKYDGFSESSSRAGDDDGDDDDDFRRAREEAPDDVAAGRSWASSVRRSWCEEIEEEEEEKEGEGGGDDDDDDDDDDYYLPDGDLLRANQILGLCAHACVHFAARPRTTRGRRRSAAGAADDDDDDGATTKASSTSSPGAWVSEDYLNGERKGGGSVVGKSNDATVCPFGGGGGGGKRTNGRGATTTTRASSADDVVEDSSAGANAGSAGTSSGSGGGGGGGGGRSEHLIPPSILRPWRQVSSRLGRPAPTFTYYDYFTLNVVPRRPDDGLDGDGDCGEGGGSGGDAAAREMCFDVNRSPQQTYEDLRCDVQVFGDASENVFVLVNHDMEFQSKDLVGLCCDAVDHVIAGDDDALAKVLCDVGSVIKRVTDAFKHAAPNSRSSHYCDPVSWSKTIGMLIPPVLDDEYSMSGLQSSVVHLLDVFLGRYDYDGEMGGLALAERPWLPSLHRKFFDMLKLSPSVREYVRKSTSRSLRGTFDRVVRLFAGEQGLLGAHRIKTMGFLELGIKTGRTESSGQTAKADGRRGWQSRVWRKINEDFLLGIEQRLKLQTDPVAEGFTLALVQNIEELSPGSQSYRITMNIKNAGLSYKAGDRLEVLPANTPSIVTRMLRSLRVDRGDLSVNSLSVRVEGAEWRSAISRWYRELADEVEFPLPSILRIMQLRPITRGMFDGICDAVGMRGNAEAEALFRRGALNDVPDLVDALHQIADETCGALYNLPSQLCSILPPNEARLYSIANSPPQGVQPTIVTIVISKLWFQAEGVVAEKMISSRLSSLRMAMDRQPSGVDSTVSESTHSMDGSNSSALDRSSSSSRVIMGQNTRSSSFLAIKGSTTGDNKTKEKVVHLGVCTSFLLNQALFQYVPIRVAEEEAFHLPSINRSTGVGRPPALVFLALGSGAAPIMAFLEELLDRDIFDCPQEIYFCWGLRSAKDLIWRSLLSKAVKNIGLKLCVSFSGEFKTVETDDLGNINVVDGRKERVTTTLLRGHWPETLSRLAKHTGHFYLCGHPSLELSFRAVLESALSSAGKLSPKESSFQYERLVANGRLHADCFFSGSNYDPSLPDVWASDVARHTEFGDVWWIYKGSVYNVSSYVSLHPGGEKILFDKAGRDCTEDFEVAHGKNNLRIESAMQPYKIGNVSTALLSDRYPDRHAYTHAVTFLHTLTEIKNVFYLDINMFPADEECNACPHSISMRCKTAEKFVTSTLPLVISSVNCLCNELERQIPRSTLVCLKRSVSSQLAGFMKTLQQLIGTVSAEGAYSSHPSIVTEICRIGYDFVSDVHHEAVDWLSSIENQFDDTPMDTFPNLHAMCRRALYDIQRCVHSMNIIVPKTTSDLNTFRDALSTLGGRWRHVAPYLDLNACEQLKFKQGETILRKNDIVSDTYIVLSGEIGQNGRANLIVGEVFGAVSSISKANYKKSVMGNELMKHTMKVNSSECVVCAISPRQIMLARKAFRANAFCPRYAGVVNSKNWRRALTFAKTIAKMETVTKVNALRCTSLYQFVDSGVCESIAEQCTEQSVAAGEYFCQIGDEADRAWILLEGTVDAVIEGAVTARYTKYGTLFGETAFVEEGNGLRGASLIAVEDAHCYCIPRRTIESLCLDPLLQREATFKWLTERLSSSQHFQTIPAQSMIGLCQHSHQVHVWPTQNLFEKGEVGDTIYVLSSGTLEITDGVDTSLLKVGEIAGLDVMYQDDLVHSQTCTGKEKSTCWAISRSVLVDYGLSGNTGS